MKNRGTTFLVIFTLFWSTITLLFDGFCGYALFGQLRSYGFTPVDAKILTSEVTSSSDGDGTTYGAGIRYEYRVDGHRYESDRVRFGQMKTSGGKWAGRTVSENPRGSVRPAYYNPSDPAEAVLQRGVSGTELFFALFLTPFNVVMLLMGAFTVRSFRAEPPAGGAHIAETTEEVRVLFNPYPPHVVALGAAGVAAFGLMFIVAIPFGFDGPLWVMILAWCMVLGAGVTAYLHQRKNLAGGRADLTIDPHRGVLTLAKGEVPAIKSLRELRTAWRAAKTPRGVSLDRVRDVAVEERVSNDSEGTSTSYMVVLVLADRAGEVTTNMDVESWTQRERAESFAAWLRGALGLGAHRVP